MMKLRKSEERGATKIAWLDSKHSFSFGGYQDAEHVGFGNLLVINEDKVEPGAGFGRHGHADMEIVSYVLEGELGHRDSTGTDGVIRAGEIQRMSAGTGIQHSEMNASTANPVHFLQIWIQPSKFAVTPGYEQVAMPPITKRAQLDVIAGPEGGPGAVTLHADARLHRVSLAPAASMVIPLDASRQAWLQVVRGALTANGQPLKSGDGLSIREELNLSLTSADAPSEALLFDLNRSTQQR
jgi:redox-sensitive bicupin YhaK (pirin superfamily)